MKPIKWDDKRRHIDKLSHKDKVRFALFCAKQVEHVIEAPEAKECIRIVELWLDGKATVDECRQAANAADAAADAAYAVYYAANAAANAADAAADAASAYAAAGDAANAADAAAYAANAAANAANAAAYAADAAAYAAYAADAADDTANIKQKQMDYLYELIHIDEIVEQQLLGVI